MCKLHGYHYSCGHFIRYPLSRCRGTFTKARKRRLRSTTPCGEDPGRIAACVGECYIIITSPSPCGSCLYEQFQHHWKARIAEAEKAYREALDRGLKMGLGLWGWGGRGWGGGGSHDDKGSIEYGGGDDDDNDSEGREESTEDDGGQESAKEAGLEGEGTDKKQKQQSQHGLKEEIERRSRVLDDLRDQFNADSWAIRKQFPIIDRRISAGPKIRKRVELGPSPLRCEVFPEDVVLRERRAGYDEDDDHGSQRYPTFQAFFVDTYGGVSSDDWNGYSNSLDGDAWGAKGAGQLATTGAWDANIVANINLANALKDEEDGPTGDESYYAEYNRFNVSHPEDDDQGFHHDATSEDDVNGDGNSSPTCKESVVAYGPQTRFPPLMSEEELFAPGPDVVPP